MKVDWVVKTNQGAFDRVVRHLSKMTGQAKERKKGSSMTSCMYETKNGEQCATGCLIRTKGQRLNLNEAGAIKPSWLEGSNLSPELIIGLQVFHDNPSNWDQMGFKGYRKLRALAKRHHLSTKVLDQILAEKGIEL